MIVTIKVKEEWLVLAGWLLLAGWTLFVWLASGIVFYVSSPMCKGAV